MNRNAPGLYWSEIDLSGYAQGSGATTVAIVGTATKGPVNDKTFLGTQEQVIKNFGYPSGNHYAVYAALNFLKAGSNVWFSRAASESAPPDVAEIAFNDVDSTANKFLAKDPGTFYNNLQIDTALSGPTRTIATGIGTDFTDVGGPGPWTLTLNLNEFLVKSAVKVFLDTVLVAEDDGLGALVAVVPGHTGTVDYDTGQVDLSFTVDPSAATEVLVQGQNYSSFFINVTKFVENTPYVLESFNGLLLDTREERYYKDVLANSFILGDLTLANYPTPGSYILAGGSDGTTGIDFADFVGVNLGGIKTGIQVFAERAEVEFNAILCPGVNEFAVVKSVEDLATTRQDSVALLDIPSGFTPENAIDWINGNNEYASQGSLNSSYASIYYPYVAYADAYNDDPRKLLPPSIGAATSLAIVDNELGVHYPPVGANTGSLIDSIGVERILNDGEVNLLDQNRINVVSDIPGIGVQIINHKTTQIFASSLDRLAARRNLITIELALSKLFRQFLSKPMNDALYRNVVNAGQPYLDAKIGEGALDNGEVVCNEDTNQFSIIDNTLTIRVFLQLTKYSDRIFVDFIILRNDVKIEEYVGEQF